MNAQSPIVGTGLEKRVAEDSRVLINAEADGIIEYVDASTITIKYDRTDNERLVSFNSDSKSYTLANFKKNQPEYFC